jgi:hypothetical protein
MSSIIYNTRHTLAHTHTHTYAGDRLFSFFQFGYTHLTNQLTKERWTTPFMMHWKKKSSAASHKEYAHIFPHVSCCMRCIGIRDVRVIHLWFFICVHIVERTSNLFAFTHTESAHRLNVYRSWERDARCVCARVRALFSLDAGQIFGRVLIHTRTCVRPFSACYLDSHVMAQSLTARQPFDTPTNAIAHRCYQICVSPCDYCKAIQVIAFDLPIVQWRILKRPFV